MTQNHPEAVVRVVSSREIAMPPFDEQLKQWGISLGVPPADQGSSGIISIPNKPHVFLCKSVLLSTDGNSAYQLKDAMVMFGHGAVENNRLSRWVFSGTDKPVFQTVEAYENIARRLNWPQVDIILACREKRGELVSGVRVLFTNRLGIRYVYPDSVITYIPIETARLNPSVGVSELFMISDKWYGIDEWHKTRRDAQTNRRIPNWAKMPAK